MKILLIKKDKPIPNWYKPELMEVENGYYLDKKAACYLKELLKCARQDGLDMVVFSAYRSPAYQKKLFDEDIDRYMKQGMSYDEAFKKTNLSIAVPGTSEHNAGLAADLSGKGWEGEITEDFEKTEEFKWLKENSYKFGFIMRHPKGKTNITEYNYEPWHFRFVGCHHAEIIMRNGLTLEEYLEIQCCR